VSSRKSNHSARKRELTLYQFKELFNGKIGILYDDPQGSPGNFRVVGNRRWAPDRMPEVNMTSFLVIHDISPFT
jgi:hypothetical protein